MKTIRYYMAPQSPWTWLGHDRLVAMAERHGAQIDLRPADLNRVFPVSGGLPLAKRAPQRQAYRLVELPRWSKFTGVPLNLHPKFFPVAGDAAARLIIAATEAAGTESGLKTARALLRAVWVEERDIADPATLTAIAGECGLDAAALDGVRDRAREIYDRNTQAAIEAQVFGVPWYEYHGEPFWGQDRLELLERTLAEG
ncbi:MAG: 2-hydroxychromene-2-carboxylate isomerase [Burkholderiaceae bacterium]